MPMLMPMLMGRSQSPSRKLRCWMSQFHMIPVGINPTMLSPSPNLFKSVPYSLETPPLSAFHISTLASILSLFDSGAKCRTIFHGPF